LSFNVIKYTNKIMVQEVLKERLMKINIYEDTK
jgi:hypothetical protein